MGSKTLLLGLGGTGSRVIDEVARVLNGRGIPFNEGNICCAVLDTNENDQKNLGKSGTGIPIIGTGKPLTIETYFANHPEIRAWMPGSPSLMKESMSDGASQMRVKSRLAFFDADMTKSIHVLEQHIERLFNDGDAQKSKIRVMIVSSLAGGTGSGMFLQTALWVRKFFDKHNISSVTIRGIFLLPDIFIDTLEDIRQDPTEIQSLNANAYAAVSELNAITKVKQRGYRTLLPLTIDNLYANETDGRPVFDYCFFLDSISENGAAMTSISDYEKLAANLVYMQMYAPMHDDLYSEEDNLFKRFQNCKDPVYGSCGTAKAQYPKDSVVEYCALKAAEASISSGWRRLDNEILDKKRKEKEREKKGAVITKRVNPREEYIRLFDKYAGRTGTQVGTDRLFLTLSKQTKNVRIENDTEVMTDKVEDFMLMLTKELATSVVDESLFADMSGFLIKNRDSWIESFEEAETLKPLVKKKRDAVENYIAQVGEQMEAAAEELADRVLTTDMGDKHPQNAESVYALLTGKDENEEVRFIHPVAARYILCRLAAALAEQRDKINVDACLKAARDGYGNGKKQVVFDNPVTREVEGSPEKYLESKAFLQSKKKFIKAFKKQYVQFNASQNELCRAYAVNYLIHDVCILLVQRLETLIKAYEAFFDKLIPIAESLRADLNSNVEGTSGTENGARKTIYVCASREDKDAIYDEIGLQTDEENAEINRIVTEAMYGRFCASENPLADNNEEWKYKDVTTSFAASVCGVYRDLIESEHLGEVDLDVYSALSFSTQRAYLAEQEKKKKKGEEDTTGYVGIHASADTEAAARSFRDQTALQNLVERLKTIASPTMIVDEEQPSDPNEHLVDARDDDPDPGTEVLPTRKRKTFWGFHPVLAAKCPSLAAVLGVDVNKQKNDAYSKNELDCYRAVYGIMAKYIPKFNEMKDGAYFRSYRQVVSMMNQGAADEDQTVLINTPHLDKRWHMFIPYITEEKRLEEDSKFFKLFWLAVGYGMIRLDGGDKYQVRRFKKTVTGAVYTNFESVIFKGKQISKPEVLELISALRLDAVFRQQAQRLEKKYEAECGLPTYDTVFFRGEVHVMKDDSIDAAEGSTRRLAVGGLSAANELNAVTLIVRYKNNTRSDIGMTATLKQSLEDVIRGMVVGKYEENETEKVRLRTWKLCREIYDASAMQNKNLDLFDNWISGKDSTITD